MRLMGIDPGIERTGFAILEQDGQGALTLLDYGRIYTPKTHTLSERLHMLAGDLSQLVKQWKPNIAALEELFFSKNVKTALTVSHARGIILEIFEEHGVPHRAFNPGTIKRTVTGDGRADKVQIQKMVGMTFGIQPKSDDACDAIACALCLHSHLAIPQSLA